MALEETTCVQCGTSYYVTGGSLITDVAPSDGTCAVCLKLGDRSLLWLLRAMKDARSDEERATIRARFAAAKDRSTIEFEAGRTVLRRR